MDNRRETGNGLGKHAIDRILYTLTKVVIGIECNIMVEEILVLIG